jgi:hypothetical protein
MKIHKLVTLAFLAIIPVFALGNDLTGEDIVSAGNIVKQYTRPRLSMINCIEALKYVYGDNAKSSGIKYLRDIYSRQLELAASHHFVIWDQSKNSEIKKLSYILYDLEYNQAKLCKGLDSPDAQVSLYNFLGRSMAVSVTAEDSTEAEKLRAQALRKEFTGFVIKNFEFELNIKEFCYAEKQASEILDSFIKSKPNLKNSDAFITPTAELIAEFNQRGVDGINKLKSSEYFFYRTLIGQSIDRLFWKFEESDRLIALQINHQKTVGNCVISDVTMTVEGVHSGVRNLSFKVAHLVRSDRGLEVIGVN